MNLDADALEKLRQLCVAGCELTELKPDADIDAGVYYVLNPITGEHERHIAERHINCLGSTLNDFAALVQREVSERGVQAIVFVDQWIVGLLDTGKEGRRLDKITLMLTISEAFAIFQKHSQAYEHNAFVRLLRTVLGRGVQPEFLQAIRSIKIQKNTAGGSRIETGLQAVSAEVRREIEAAGGGAIPESVEFEVPVYEELANLPEVWRAIACVLEVDLEEATFELIPKAGEVAAAKRSVDEWIRDQLQHRLQNEAVLVVCGGPARLIEDR